MLEFDQDIIWRSDGSIERINIYQIYPQNTIDRLHLLNIYGQKLYNNFCYMKQAQAQSNEDMLNDFEFDYSRL